MPRKSAVAIATLEPRGRRLEPPPGLSEAERTAFVATVRSVKPGHFAAEDAPLLTAYCCRHCAGARHRPGSRGGRGRGRGGKGEDEGPPADRPRARCRKPDEAGESLTLGSDGAGPEPQSPPAWHGRAERPAAVGIPAGLKARPIDPRRAQYFLVRGPSASAGRTFRRPGARDARVHAG